DYDRADQTVGERVLTKYGSRLEGEPARRVTFRVTGAGGGETRVKSRSTAIVVLGKCARGAHARWFRDAGCSQRLGMKRAGARAAFPGRVARRVAGRAEEGGEAPMGKREDERARLGRPRFRAQMSPDPGAANVQIYLNTPLPGSAVDHRGRLVAPFPTNKLNSTKYTPLTFLPKNLFEQFRRVAKCFPSVPLS
ncbi:MAG: hypothetical protein BJ554DRAFT_4115, partial [Olpidium bornovanus]